MKRGNFTLILLLVFLILLISFVCFRENAFFKSEEKSFSYTGRSIDDEINKVLEYEKSSQKDNPKSEVIIFDWTARHNENWNTPLKEQSACWLNNFLI